MDRSKVCFKCNVPKPLGEFYKHPRMSDGCLNKCKECTKRDVAEHRNANLEKIRAYDRERSQLKHRVALRTEVNRAWRDEDGRRQKCHGAVRRAIISGELVRKPCERCGEEKSVAHHENYDEPLNVTWLCQPCHMQRHKEINEESKRPKGE